MGNQSLKCGCLSVVHNNEDENLLNPNYELPQVVDHSPTSSIHYSTLSASSEAELISRFIENECECSKSSTPEVLVDLVQEFLTGHRWRVNVDKLLKLERSATMYGPLLQLSSPSGSFPLQFGLSKASGDQVFWGVETTSFSDKDQDKDEDTDSANDKSFVRVYLEAFCPELEFDWKGTVTFKRGKQTVYGRSNKVDLQAFLENESRPSTVSILCRAQLLSVNAAQKVTLQPTTPFSWNVNGDLLQRVKDTSTDKWVCSHSFGGDGNWFLKWMPKSKNGKKKVRLCLAKAPPKIYALEATCDFYMNGKLVQSKHRCNWSKLHNHTYHHTEWTNLDIELEQTQDIVFSGHVSIDKVYMLNEKNKKTEVSPSDWVSYGIV